MVLLAQATAIEPYNIKIFTKAVWRVFTIPLFYARLPILILFNGFDVQATDVLQRVGQLRQQFKMIAMAGAENGEIPVIESADLGDIQPLR